MRCLGCSNAVLGNTGEGGKHPVMFPRILAFYRTDETERDGSMFAMLEARDR
jgi:hypothetical protein